VVRRSCGADTIAGRPCGAPAQRSLSFCYWHDPDKAEDLAEAQRLGGLRRKRERTVAAAYDFTGLGSVESILRIFEIAAIDVLGLETSIAKSRVLINAGTAALKVLEIGELEARIALLEAAVKGRPEEPPGGLLGEP
jgi:hypothetical protein